MKPLRLIIPSIVPVALAVFATEAHADLSTMDNGYIAECAAYAKLAAVGYTATADTYVTLNLMGAESADEAQRKAQLISSAFWLLVGERVDGGKITSPADDWVFERHMLILEQGRSEFLQFGSTNDLVDYFNDLIASKVIPCEEALISAADS